MAKNYSAKGREDSTRSVFIETNPYATRFFQIDVLPLQTKSLESDNDYNQRRNRQTAQINAATSAASRKSFWDHFSKSLVTIQVFTNETWAPTRLKNGGKLG